MPSRVDGIGILRREAFDFGSKLGMREELSKKREKNRIGEHLKG